MWSTNWIATFISALRCRLWKETLQASYTRNWIKSMHWFRNGIQTCKISETRGTAVTLTRGSGDSPPSYPSSVKMLSKHESMRTPKFLRSADSKTAKQLNPKLVRNRGALDLITVPVCKIVVLIWIPWEQARKLQATLDGCNPKLRPTHPLTYSQGWGVELLA